MMKWLVAEEPSILFRHTEVTITDPSTNNFFVNIIFHHQQRHQECYARSFKIQGKVPNERYHGVHTQRYTAGHLVAENSSRSGFDCGRINLQKFASAWICTARQHSHTLEQANKLCYKVTQGREIRASNFRRKYAQKSRL